MSDVMMFPDTVEEFMEWYKVIDTEHVYSNGTEYVPIFRMKQWFEHLPTAEPRKGKWVDYCGDLKCDQCGCEADLFGIRGEWNYCPNCGAKMGEDDHMANLREYAQDFGVTIEQAEEALEEFRKNPKTYTLDEVEAELTAEKKGKWVILDDKHYDVSKCSECGVVEYFNKGWKRFNFCPNCGARMES